MSNSGNDNRNLRKSEIDDILIRRAENYVGRHLTRKECSALLAALKDSGTKSEAYPDRSIIPILNTICGFEKDLPETRYVIYSMYTKSGDLDKDRLHLKKSGFIQSDDFIVRDQVTESHPYMLLWKITSGNYNQIRTFDKNMAPSLSGTLRPMIGVLESLSREELYDMIKMAIVDTTSLVTGMRIVRNAFGNDRRKLQEYMVNLHLLGANLGKTSALGNTTPMVKKSWGSEITVPRMNPEIQQEYMAYVGLYPLYPNSDVGQPTDTSRQRGDYLTDTENGRKPKKKERRLGDAGTETKDRNDE